MVENGDQLGLGIGQRFAGRLWYRHWPLPRTTESGLSVTYARCARTSPPSRSPRCESSTSWPSTSFFACLSNFIPAPRVTPHDVAIERARAASQKVDAYLENLRSSGVLREFNRAFKSRRMAATANGQGLLSFKG